MNRPDQNKCTDRINHPSHYNKGKHETIEIIEQIVTDYPQRIGFNVGQVIKYLSRAPYKENSLTDLRKAEWYLKRAIHHAKKEQL